MSTAPRHLSRSEQRQWHTLLRLVKEIVCEAGRDSADFHAAEWLEDYQHHPVPSDNSVPLMG